MERYDVGRLLGAARARDSLSEFGPSPLAAGTVPMPTTACGASRACGKKMGGARKTTDQKDPNQKKMVHEAVLDATFAALDTSGDGSVSRAELAKAVRGSAVLAAMLGVPHTLREAADGGDASPLYALNAAFDAADTNGDGRLTKDELRALLA